MSTEPSARSKSGGGEKTVTERQQYAGAFQPTVSHHLMVLKAHGVVDLRRARPFARYSIIEPRVKAIRECIRAGECGGRAPAFPDA